MKVSIIDDAFTGWTGHNAGYNFSICDELSRRSVKYQVFAHESARELANTVRAMTDDDLTREFPWRRGPVSGAGLIEIPLRNMHYHGGQVNLLQLLYGDTEFRVPPPPTPKV